MKDKTPAKAIALRWDGTQAPYVAASGEERLAELIMAVARMHEVPIYQNQSLVDVLARLEVGEEIPEELYRCIAELIAFVYRLKGKRPEGFRHQRQQREEKDAGGNWRPVALLGHAPEPRSRGYGASGEENNAGVVIDGD